MKHEKVFARRKFTGLCPRSRAGSRQRAGAARVIRFASLGALAAIALVQGAIAGASEAIAAGRVKADQVCANCHGLDGQAASGGNSALPPKLTAQRKQYLVARLRG